MAANSLSYQFKTATIAVKLIVINVAVFLIAGITSWAMQISSGYLTRWFALPSKIESFIFQPWSIVTYSFLHADVWHILFNMLFLYVFSKFILNLFTEKRFLTVYLLGAMVGGLFFLLAFNILPVFSKISPPIIGASAAVNAIIVFIAAYTPNSPIRVFMFNLKLWHIAAFVVLKDLLFLTTSENPGGLISHLGGAVFGYLYAVQLAKGNDIGAWFEKLMDTVASWFSSKPKKKKTNMRTVHRTTKKSPTKNTKPKQSSVTKSDQQQQIDAILDKISKSGYDSLSKAEKDFLFKAGKDN